MLILMTAALTAVLTTMYHKGNLPQLDDVIQRFKQIQIQTDPPPPEVEPVKVEQPTQFVETIVEEKATIVNPPEPVEVKPDPPVESFSGYRDLATGLNEITDALQQFEKRITER